MEGLASKENVDEVKALMVQMFEKLRFLENIVQISSAINYASNVSMEDILVAGGKDKGDNALKSLERFSWKENVWERVSSMNVGRMGATSFVYENQLFVAGGCDSDVIDVLNFNEGLLQCGVSVAKVPYIVNASAPWFTRTAQFFFAHAVTRDYCAELCLTAPYTCKHLCKMPEPARRNFAVVAFEHKVLDFGGRSHISNNRLFDTCIRVRSQNE